MLSRARVGRRAEIWEPSAGPPPLLVLERVTHPLQSRKSQLAGWQDAPEGGIARRVVKEALGRLRAGRHRADRRGRASEKATECSGGPWCTAQRHPDRAPPSRLLLGIGKEREPSLVLHGCSSSNPAASCVSRETPAR